MDKAKNLQKLWMKRSETPGSSYGSSFLTMDLNKTEDVLSKLESLHQQPHIWDFLVSLPRLHIPSPHLEGSMHAVEHFLQAVLNSLTSLEDLDWLPLPQTFSQLSKLMLNVTISTLKFLQQHRATMNESVYHLSLKNIVWDPQQVQSDLKSQFGFDDLQMEQILNYSFELKEIPTPGFLERMICVVISNMSEDETESKDYSVDNCSKASEVKNHLLHAVSWLKLCGQVFDQWQQGGLLQNMLTSTRYSLVALQNQHEEESEPWKVAEALHTVLLLLNDSSAAHDPRDSPLFPVLFQHLGKLQRVLQDLRPGPALKRLVQLLASVRNLVAQDLSFLQEILTYLETSARGFIPSGPDEMDAFFWGLKQLLTKNASVACLNGHVSEEAPPHPGDTSIWGRLWAVLCHPSFNRTGVLNELLYAVQDAGCRLQEVFIDHTDVPVSGPEGHLGWQELEMQLSEVSLSCSRLFRQPGADALPGNGASSGSCERQLVSTVIFHILEKAQLSLEKMFHFQRGFIRKTCEVARYVNMHRSFQNNLLAFSEDSPCYAENMDWKVIIHNYFVFFNNLVKFPMTSITRALNFTKHLSVVENKLQTAEDGQMDTLLSFVEILEGLLVPSPSDLFSAPEFRNFSFVTQHALNGSVLWINHSKSLASDPQDVDAQKPLEFGKLVIEKMKTLKNRGLRTEYKNILRFIESKLLEINPEPLELWFYGTSKDKRAKLKTLSPLLKFSVPESEILSKSFNFSQLFHFDWPKSPAMNLDFIHLSEMIINSLYEFSFLTQEQVSIVLDTVYTLQNASDLFVALSEAQMQEAATILTHIHLNIFKDKDAALLLRIYSSFYQYIHKFLNIQNRESLIIYLTQISRHILDIIKQFNFQNISEALSLISEAAKVLQGIPEASYCQQLLSMFNFLQLQAQSLLSTQSQMSGVILTTLTGLKQLLSVDEGFRVSLLEYVNQLSSGSAEVLLASECFILENETSSSLSYSGDKGSSLTLPWARVFSNLSLNGSVLSEFMPVHCTLSWLQMWTEIWGSISRIFQLDLNMFTPMHVGLTQLLDELENDENGVKVSKSCQGIFPTHHAARLMLNLFNNATQVNGIHDWAVLLDLKEFWVALGNELAMVRKLNLDQAEKSFFTMEASLRQLKTLSLNTNISREILYSVLDVFIALSKAVDSVDRKGDLIDEFLSNDLTDRGANHESVITELREIILFLRNVSNDQALLLCTNVFQGVTELILEDSLLHVNTSKRTVQILAMLNSTFSSENTASRLKGCTAWIDVINRLFLMYNSSFSQSHLYCSFGSFKDMENKMSSALNILTWVLNKKEPLCSLNESDVNCVNIYLKDIADFLNIILTTSLEKERVPKFQILLTLLNDSTKQVRMIVTNLTRDLEFASQSNWKHLTELILRPTEMSGEIPYWFQNMWLHIIALGKEMQNLLKDVYSNFLGNESSSNTVTTFSVFSTSLKEKDISSLGSLAYHLANYLALNLHHDFQNSSEEDPQEILKVVGLSILLMRDVFNSLMPAVSFDIPHSSGHAQVLKKVASLMHSLKKADIELLVNQLEQISESLIDFFKNLSRSSIDDLGVNMFVGLVEKFVDSSHSWSINHLLRLSRLLPKEVVNAVVDAYYALPHVVGFLRRVTDKNITEGLRDVYNFTLLHGISVFNITKEEFAIVIKTLLDIVELISKQPTLVSEALTCLPVIWCWNHTMSRFEQNPNMEGCNVHGLMSSSFYQSVVRILDLLHLPPRDEDSQCLNENSHLEITKKAVCVIHELMDWNSVLSELFELFHIKTLFVKTVQKFWLKVLPFIEPSGNKSNGSFSELCPAGTIKQVTLQIREKLKHVNFTEFLLGENILNKIDNLVKILSITKGIETPVQQSISLSLERVLKLIFSVWSLKNSTHYSLSPFMVFLNTNLTESSLASLSNLIKNSKAGYNFEDLLLTFKQNHKNSSNELHLGQLHSEVNKKIQGMALQNITWKLPHFLESLDSSLLKALEIIEDFLLVTKYWLHEYANEDHFRLIQRLFIAKDNESSTDETVFSEDLTTYLDYLKDISRKDDLDVAFLTHLLTNFSFVPLLLESMVMNSINNVSGISDESAPILSDTDIQILNFINLTLSHMQSREEEITALPLGSMKNFMKWLLETYFSFFLKEPSENKISLLLKDFHRDISAEMSFVPRDKILEVLKLDQFFTWMNKDIRMSILSSFKTLYHLIKNSFALDSRQLYIKEYAMKTEENLDFFTVVTEFLYQVNNSEDLFKLNHNLRSVLQLVRESSTAMSNLVGIFLNSSNQDSFTSCPAFRDVTVAKLTDLFAFINSSFILRDRETLESAVRLFGAISRVGEKSRILEPVLEISRTLNMLVRGSAELVDHATLVDSMVGLLKLAKKVSREMAAIFRTHFILKDTMKSSDTLYSIMQQRVQHIVKKVTTLKRVDHSIFGKTKDLLMPFLNLTFWMTEVAPNVSQDSDTFNTSSSTLSFMNQSKDFSATLEEIAEFLTSVKINLRDLERLVVVFKNGTQFFSIDSVNVWEEILDCLVSINNFTNKIDSLKLNSILTTSSLQGMRPEGISELINVLNDMLIENSTERETFLKMVIDLTLQALWNGLQEDNWDVFNLLLTFAQHPDNLLKTIETVIEASSGIKSDYGGGASKDLVFNMSLIQNITRHQFAKSILIGLSKIALSRDGPPPNNAEWIQFLHTLFHPILGIFSNSTVGQAATSAKNESTNEKMNDIPHGFKPTSDFQKHLKALFAWMEQWKKVPLVDQSVFRMCQAFRQLEKPSEAVVMLHRVEMMALRVLIIVAENPSSTKDILCALLSCKRDGMRHLLLSALQGVALVLSHYQEIEKMWSSPDQLDCEHLSRNVSTALESFKSNLENITGQDCTCQPLVETIQHHMHMLVNSLETWMSRNPIMNFLSNFTVTQDVKVKDLIKNITKLMEELQSSLHLSDETIHSVLEANISHSKVLSSVLTVVVSGKCNKEILHLLLTFPEGEESWFAVKELCSLRRSQVYSLLVVMSRNLNLRTFIYRILIPSEANGLLNSLLDVISSLSSILARAQHVFEYLPEFLHTFKIAALLDMPDFQQVLQDGQARSSLQSVMKVLCKDQTSFLSQSNVFVNLPRVDELLEDDKEKFNIPKDSTPFCLKLYQEILQSPNGALLWSFLKPILHGKILYTPNSPAINEVIEKANYTFYFVDKLKILSETLLKMSSLFQGSGNGQMFNQLQDALRNKFIRNFVETQLHIDVDKLTEDLQTYGQMLGKMFNHVGAARFQVLGGILVNLSSCVALDRFQAAESVGVLETKAHELMQQNGFLASVIFNSSSVHRRSRSAPPKLPPHITYTIRTSVLYSMRTDMIKNPSWKFHPQSLPADGFKYNYIFVPLQDMIERAIIVVQTGQETLEPTTQAQAAPYPCHTSDLFLNNVGFFFPLIMMLTWMVSVASMVRKLVYEREIQIEEYMRLMGVHPAVSFLAWFLENVATLALSSAALAVILKTSGIFAHSDAFIVFLYFLDFGVSAVMLSYFLSAFFNQANTAALCTSLGYMISFLPYIVLLVLHNQLGFATQSLLCLLSTTAFGQGVFFITFLEGQEEGIQWNNMYQAPEPGGMTFGWVCWVILFDSSLYCLCGWYFSNLVPGPFGFQKPWYFPFTAPYWESVCGLMGKRELALSEGLFFYNDDFGSKGSSQHNGPGELEGGTPGVALISVTKEYENHKMAVHNLTLDFYRGQITALLGTNGAGKTTIISMLMGLYPPTSGIIIINGKNLQTDLSRVREELGVCLQQDVLLDNLTVREHLLLFASLKVPWWTKKELQQQVDKTLDEVGLTPHQHKSARALSGGMKRKLSIGIAFIGMSRTVVLDEPTSGVDPCSRRSVWDILLKFREGRTIIFTTHHLDEAEMLSDRVAVLQQGTLRCCAPPASLKESYGQGLTLTLTRQPSVLEVQEPNDVARITSLIQVYIPQAFLKDSSRGELTYTIPKDADKACFKGLCQALDQNLQHLHLTGYGISDTTLEEVFLMLLQDTNKKSYITPGTNELQSERPSGPSPGHCSSVRTPPVCTLPEPVRGCQLLLGQATALLRKRLLRTRRAWKSTTSDLLLPVLFVALAMGLFMVEPLAITYPPLKLTPGHYERAETYFFSSTGGHGIDLTRVLLQKFGDRDSVCADVDQKNSSSWHRDPYSGLKFQDSCGCLMCPNKSAGAPYLTNCLGHTLLNLSGYDVEEYLLVPSEKPRLGGWSFGLPVPNEVQDSNTNISKPRTLAKVWYNQKGFHSLPSYLNHLNNLILWQHLPRDTAAWKQHGITLYSHPYGGALLNEDKILESIRQCGVALCIVLGFSILSASIGSSVVRDRVTGAKRLQHISGLGYKTYWLTNFLYDMIFYLVSVCLCVAIIAAFQLTAFTFRENLEATALLLALFGYAVLPWMYLMSRIFSSSDVAFISYISLNFVFGLCTMLMTTMPRLLAIISKAQNLKKIYNVLKWVFIIFPQFCLGQGLIELCYNQIKYDLTHSFGIDSYVSPFEMNFLGWIFVELTLQGTILLLLRILLHGDLLRSSRSHSSLQGTFKSAKDIDVEKEQMRVLEGRTDGDILVLCNLSKSYGSIFRKTTVVKNISLGIPRGECFGLLGVNGAGKSTTFKMLNGELAPSSGRVFIRTPRGFVLLGKHA